MKTRLIAATIFCVLASALATRAASAAGALIVNGAGAPLVWSGVAPWNPDQGTLGGLDNAAAIELVESALAVWEAVPTAAVSFANAGSLPVDVTAANVSAYVGVCGDGLSPVVFDTDGSITDALLGAGASTSVLGFASPECGTFVPPRITEASAVLNGKFIDGIVDTDNPEIDIDDFAGVFVHEFGHYLNLDHSQINVIEAFDSTPADDDAVATMFPIVVNGQAALTLARDDEVALSMLYPSADFATTSGAITGQVLRSDGTTPFQGAYVIARNVADPRHDAIGCASGARYFPNNPGGPPSPALIGAYELPGLTPGASYTVEIEPVNARFTGDASVGPLDVPVPLPGPPEFWSGADEAATSPPDDPDAPGVPIAIDAGVVVPGIDVIMNTPQAPANDACDAAIVVGPLPFRTSVNTTSATGAADDPVQTCVSGATTGRSVWYRFTAPGDGLVTVSTAGSAYDTVASVHTGVCGALAPVACSDDGGGGLQSEITFPVSSGTTYLIDVSAFGSTPGGRLTLRITLDPAGSARCDADPPGSCIPGGGSTSTDCIVEWLVEPIPPVPFTNSIARQVPDYRISCIDGDPRCDFDGAAQPNGRCTFHVALCLENGDPRPAAAGCIPSAITSFELRAPRRSRTNDPLDLAVATTILDAIVDLGAPPGTLRGDLVRLSPGSVGANTCTHFLPLTVPHGSRVIRSQVRTVDGKRDGDKLRLTCD